MPDLGDLMPLAVEIRDSDGVLTNASTVTLTITLPDGTTTTPFIANPPSTTGRYIADYTPLQYGRHRIRWVSIGPQVAFEDIFDVRSEAATGLISLSEAKRHLNIPVSQTTDDEELRSFIEATTYAIERHRNEIIARRTVSEVLDTTRSKIVQLGYRPVISLTSIESVDASWSPADWRIDNYAGVIYRIAGSDLSGFITFVYEAGYVQVPSHYVMAAKIVLAHLWQTQRIATVGPQTGFGVRSQSQGQEQIMTPSGFGTALPPRAIELLGPRPSLIV